MGTPTKTGRRSILGTLLFLFMILNGFVVFARGLASISAISQNLPEAPNAGRFVVSSFTYARLAEADRAMRELSRIHDPAKRDKLEQMWRRHLDRLFTTEIRFGAFTEDEEGARLRQMRDRFARDGIAGFASARPDLFAISTATWPGTQAAGALFVRALALLCALLTPTLLFTFLGTNNKDLGQVEWSFEWLYTFPVSTRALFASRLIIYSFLNQFVWWLLLPFAVLMYVAGGRGWNAVPLGFGVMLYLAIIAGAATLLAEVALRKFLAVNRIKSVQAVFTVLGAVFLMFAFAVLFSNSVAGVLLRAASSTPAWVIWNPLSLPVITAVPGASLRNVQLSVLAMVVVTLAAASSAMFGAEWLTRDGLIRASGPYQGSRRIGRAGISRSWLRGIAGQEFLVLIRDRNLFVQVFIVPLLVPAYYLLADSHLRSALIENFRRVATVAYAVGALSFASSAMLILNRESPALWQLVSFPRSLLSMLLEKAAFWAAVGVLYGGAIFLLIVHFSPHLQVTSWSYLALAMYGIVLYAFIAAGIGILATNVGETEPQRQINYAMLYLYFILAAMYGSAIYAPSLWIRIAQLVLSTLLAFALWQKVKDLCPYILDPTQYPPRTIGLADGMIAALAFFVLQTLIAMVMLRTSTSSFAEQATVAYTVAGVIVGAAAFSIFWVQGVPDLWKQIGFARRDGQERPIPLLRILALGAFWGAAAALAGVAYLQVLSLFPQWQAWKQDAELSSFVSHADQPLWLCAMVIVSAPIVEEFIFRGLIFQGLRRSAGGAVAVLGSAALFALIHPPIAVIPVFGLGIAAAISFEQSGVLWAPIVAHAIYNACVLFVSRL